jgi:hypothetical protein
MPTILKTKNSVTTTVVPTTLQQGELAVNITDKKLWVGNAATTPVQLLGTGADGTFTNISVSDVASFADGTVSLPSITNIGDTNTGIFFPDADTIAFTEGGTESMRVNSSGNLGIGTTSPSARLHVSTSSAGLAEPLWLNNSQAVGANVGSRFVFTGTSSNNGLAAIDGAFAGATTADGGYMAFNTRAVTSGTLTERMRIDSSGNVGIGLTPPVGSGNYRILNVGATVVYGNTGVALAALNNNADINDKYVITGVASSYTQSSGNHLWFSAASGSAGALISFTERMRINSDGNVLVGTTSYSDAVAGTGLGSNGFAYHTRASGTVLYINRLTNDGNLVEFAQDGNTEGTISVSGSTVSYNGGHLSRWSQLPDGSKDESIVKGTVMSNLDDMCVWEKDGVVAENEQLNKMKVSDVEGDTNVAGVFVNWTMDEEYGVDDMNVAMTGDMIIRIADGVVVQKGDLLMSAGDGTAKPQGDDIVRSKTVAKVTSNYVTCTYEDGSYCVPCVLMAC